MSHTVTLTVTGMTCGGCENAVTRALGRLSGVERVSASHTARQITVTFEEAAITLARIREGISALGYTPAEP